MHDFPTREHSTTRSITDDLRALAILELQQMELDETDDRLDLKEALWSYDPRPVRRRVHPLAAVAGLLLIVAFVGRWVTS